VNIPVTKEQAFRILDAAAAVFVDGEAVTFHNLYGPDADMGDMWLEMVFEVGNGRTVVRNIKTTEGIEWDGMKLEIPMPNGETVTVEPFYRYRPSLFADVQAMFDRLQPRPVPHDITLDSKKNKLKLWPYDGWKRDSVPEGVAFTVMSPGKYSYPAYTYPELLPRAVYQESFVVAIRGRHWAVSIHREYAFGTPDRVSVQFRETADPITKFVTLGDERSSVSHLFSQPKFIQSPVLPHYEGKSAVMLARIESRWGDCGNENIFVAFDDAGIPVGIYHEYSCC
jgi:hypothetical protein